MDPESHKVVDFAITQKGEVTGDLEKAGCKILLDRVIDKELDVHTLVTDGHTGIAKMIRETAIFSFIRHCLDVWHISKNLRKKLLKAATKNEELKAWIPKVIRQLWWACKNCAEDGDKLVRLFHGVLFHVCQVHRWADSTARGKRRAAIVSKAILTLKGKSPYPTLDTTPSGCSHGPLTNRQKRETPWLDPKGTAYGALFGVLTDTRLCNQLRKCNVFVHTNSVETFHANKLHLLPKLVGFTRDTHVALTMLAALHTNDRVDSEPIAQYRVRQYSRSAGQYFARWRNVYDKTTLHHSILDRALEIAGDKSYSAPDLKEFTPTDLPARFHGVELPALADLESATYSRM
eukprot:sb/3466300/